MSVLGLLLSFLPSALFLLLSAVLVAFACYGLYVKYVHYKYDHIPGPPRTSFFLGHSPIFLEMMRKGDEVIYDRLLEWTKTYGPVYRLNLLHYVILNCASPETTKKVLMSSKYPKDSFLYTRLVHLFGARFLGNGLVTALNHEQWYKQRRIMDPAFSSLYLRSLMGTFNERAEILMDRLSEEADNDTVACMLNLFNSVTLDVIAKIAFGIELDLLKNTTPFPKAIEACLKGMIYHVRESPFFQYLPQNWRFVNEVRDSCGLLRRTGAQWINDRKKAIENGEQIPKDILTQILKSAGQEESMTKEDEEFMVDNFVTFFIAGQETTANTLAFSIMALGQHPDVLAKLKKEVDDVIGMKREITYEDLGNLTYLSQVLKETLRIYPTVPGTTRELPEDMVIEGIPIPAGASVMFNSYVTCRMEEYFKDPLKFDPDRFHPDAPKPYYTYYPFALGPRSCLGRKFAQMEAKVVLAKIIQRFDFTLVPGQSFVMRDTATLRPRSGVLCTIKHRSSK